MSYVWDFLKNFQQKKDSNSQQQIYLDIEQIPIKKSDDKNDEDKETNHIIIDLFSEEE